MFFVALVKKQIRSFGFAGLCLLLWGLGGCVKRVNLPGASPFPGQASPAQDADAKYRLRISHEVKGIETKVWQRLARYWGVRDVWGRIVIRMHLQGTVLMRCALRRTEIQARWERKEKSWDMLARRRVALHLVPRHQVYLAWKLELARREGLCAMLIQRTWPPYSGSKPIQVDVLLTRDASAIGGSPPSPRSKPPTPLLPPRPLPRRPTPKTPGAKPSTLR